MDDALKRRLGLVASIGLVLGLVAVPLARTSLAETQIQVLDREGPFERMIDVGKAGLSPGDLIVGTHPLFAADGTTVVGRDFERLQVLRVVSGGEDFDFFYDGTIRLADGDVLLSAEGRFSDVFDPGGVTLAVTGGTGSYAAAAGSGSISATENEGEFLIVIDLITS